MLTLAAALLAACAPTAPAPPIPTSPAPSTNTPTAAIPPATAAQTLTTTPEPPAERHYIIRDGDDLVRIAGLFGVSADSILEANGLAAPEDLHLGQDLIIPESPETPGGSLYVVQAGDTPDDIAAIYGLTAEELGLSSADSVQPGQAVVLPIDLTATMGAEGCTLAATAITQSAPADGVSLPLGATFTAAWQVHNAGSCDWGEGYEMVFLHGEPMGMTNAIAVPAAQPGEIVTLSVDMTAPTEPGRYLSVWQLQAPDGTSFGLRPHVRLTVAAPTATPTPTVTVEVAAAPTATPLPPPTPTLQPGVEPTPTLTPRPTMIPVSVISGITPHAREIYLIGRTTGMRTNTFSKVGDSISDYREYLYPIGEGWTILGDYEYLAPAIEYFSTRFSTVRGWTGNSFTNDSAAAVGGWDSGDILDPYNTEVFCGRDAPPLRCEYWLTLPAVAIIMVGTNEPVENVRSGVYEQNLSTIVELSIELGVIPVLSTIPWNEHHDSTLYNAVVVRVARNYDIPLMDYWAVMETLPNHGIGPDGIHPTAPPHGNTADFTPEGLQYGYNVRNLLTLQVLDAIWRQVIY